MHDEIRAELAALCRSHADLQADHKAILLQTDFIVRALSHLLTRHFEMSNKDDFLSAVAANGTALTDNDSLLAGVVRGSSALIAAHGDGEATFADALAKVQAQGKQIATQGQAISLLGQSIAKALPADAPSAAPTQADASAPPAPAPAEVSADAPAAPAAPVDQVAPIVFAAPSA